MCYQPTRNRILKKNSKKIQKIRTHHHSFFSSQNRLEKAEKNKKVKVIDPFRSYPVLNRKLKKKIAKKFKKLINTVMDSFQAKIGWKRMRKSKNKNYRSVPFRSVPTRNRNFQKNSKNIQKIKKYHYGFISSQNRLEKAEKNRK